ncbi:MAG: transcription antitermination factor NusB [Actinobacteria bacterium]|nr:transcription antitermination factor NusB [Actinomycetota bacterium]
MTSRRRARRLAIDILFQADVTGVDARSVLTGWIGAGHDVPDFTRELVEGVRDHLEELDGVIGAHSVGWRVGRMAALDRTILRVAVSELLYATDVPAAAAIDEAVRAAKELSTEDSGRFVNGVLGKIVAERDPGP